MNNARALTAATLAGLALVSFAVTASAAPTTLPTDAEGPLDVQSAQLSQAGRRLNLSVNTAGDFALAQLNRQPRLRAPKAHYLCFEFGAKGHRSSTGICLGGSADRVGVLRIAADGSISSKRTVPASVTRSAPDRAVVSLIPGRAGLSPRRYKWRVIGQWSGPRCAAGAHSHSPCRASFPRSGRHDFRLRRVQAVGCTTTGPSLNFHGPRGDKTVALTFDDGPSDYTESVVDILRREHVTGTFFELGDQVGGRESTMRRIVRSGYEIADHSTHHSAYPSYDDISNTKRIIERTTGFTPCLFRPPYGAFNSGTVADAARAGMKTIVWDVDPRDWSTPGTGAIYSTVVGTTRPGSIILMHDGGGPRGETVAALPQIIDTLRRRGYSFATVSALLGDRMIYQPVG